MEFKAGQDMLQFYSTIIESLETALCKMLK